ncbi:hypothetical protein UY3_05285 [Chelonia mydas]|uniref:Uncharacterized protein n=1 Tax=Chelonia mydas TaxID=8469 RepID=M7BZG4_CHEMY|nr:hypothetical protein UY3_05285 [Chelonia mydas]
MSLLNVCIGASVESMDLNEPCSIMTTKLKAPQRMKRLRFNGIWQLSQTKQCKQMDKVVVEKKTNKTMLTHIAIPADRNIKKKQEEMIAKYKEPCHKVERLWKTR